MGLRAELIRQDGAPLRVRLAGRIDESATVQAALEGVKEDVTIDLSQIESINSIGLMKWVVAFSPLTDAHRVQVELVPYCLAIQANHVSDLFGRARIVSCSAPYFCSACKSNTELPVTVAELAAAKGRPPEKRCPTCQAAMDFDETDGYFAFLSRSA